MSLNHGLKKSATPLTIALFVVIATSGIMLFFHVGEAFVKELHEWLGLFLVIATGLHVARNWTSFKNYLQHRALWVAFTVAMVVTLMFILPVVLSGPKKGGIRSIVEAVAAAPLNQVAPVLGTSYEAMRASFAKEGITIDDPAITLHQIAQQSQRHLPEVIDIAMP